jgi:hypothetical protein
MRQFYAAFQNANTLYAELNWLLYCLLMRIEHNRSERVSCEVAAGDHPAATSQQKFIA